MDSATIGRLVENGFAFVAFLVVVVAFVWQVIKILDKRMGDIVVEIRALVSQQRGDSDRLIAAIDHHDERSQERHDKFLVHLADHHKIAQSLYEQLRARTREQ